MKKEFWIKTIAIVEFQNNFQNDVMENLLKCLPMEISTLLLNVSGKFDLTQKWNHNPSMVVMIVDKLKTLTQDVSE
jgi:hypothetical protein